MTRYPTGRLRLLSGEQWWGGVVDAGTRMPVIPKTVVNPQETWDGDEGNSFAGPDTVQIPALRERRPHFWRCK